jgi:hypothetical protein
LLIARDMPSAPGWRRKFQYAWLKPYDRTPPLETLRVYGASDMA